MTDDTQTGDTVLGAAAQSIHAADAQGGTVDASAPQRDADAESRAEPKVYEIGYLIVPTISERDVPREVGVIKGTLDREKVAFISEEFPKWRVLAYPMRKRTGSGYVTYENGYFGWVKFEALAQSVARIEHACKENPQILRYLLIKTVREHTLTGGKSRMERREKRGPPHDAPAHAPVSETELDKSIEKLIAE